MALLTLTEAKEALNITGSVQDNEVAAYLEAAVSMIESRIGPVDPATFTEVARVNGSGTILLQQYPVISVTSIAGVLNSSIPYLIADMYVDSELGVVQRLDRGAIRSDAYTVTYVAGRTVVPARIKQAARILVQHLWSTQRGSGGGAARGSNEPPAGVGYSMPNRVLEMLVSDLKPPRVG